MDIGVIYAGLVVTSWIERPNTVERLSTGLRWFRILLRKPLFHRLLEVVSGLVSGLVEIGTQELISQSEANDNNIYINARRNTDA